MPEEERKMELLNRNLFKEREIVFASEFLLAYRLFKMFNKITIAAPNVVSKKQAIHLLNIIIPVYRIFTRRKSQNTGEKQKNIHKIIVKVKIEVTNHERI